MGHAMEEIQKQIANIVSELMPQLCALSDEIFDYAEPGYEEYRSSAALTKWLRAHETDSYLVCRLLLEKKKKTTLPAKLTA